MFHKKKENVQFFHGLAEKTNISDASVTQTENSEFSQLFIFSTQQ